MKRLSLIVFTIFLTVGCTRAASTPIPTGQPLNFPTQSLADIVLCQPADLQTSSNSIGATGSVILGFTLTNTSKTPCALSTPAQVTLLTASGETIKVQMVDNPDIQTPSAESRLVLAPAASKIISVIWRNYCQSLPVDSLIVRIGLSEKENLENHLKISAAPHCDARAEASTMIIMPYSDPP